MYKIVYTSPSKLMADDADKAVNKKDEKGDAEKEVLDLIEKGLSAAKPISFPAKEDLLGEAQQAN
jgi:hypothetical protein